MSVYSLRIVSSLEEESIVSSTSDPLAPVERLLDEMLCESDDWTVIGSKMAEDAREAVRLLLDHARALDYAEFLRAYGDLLAFAARLEGEKQ